MKYGAVYSGRDTFTSPPCSIKALIAISKCRVRPNTEYNQLLHRESERWGKREREWVMTAEIWVIFSESSVAVNLQCLCLLLLKPNPELPVSHPFSELLESIPLLTETVPQRKVKESTNYTWNDKRLALVLSLSSFMSLPRLLSLFLSLFTLACLRTWSACVKIKCVWLYPLPSV